MQSYRPQVQIAGFFLTQTGTYQEQSIRPFQTHITTDHVNALARATNDGTNFGVAAVQDVAGSIIRPQSTIEGYANITHGWASRRFRFLMRVVEQSPFSTNSRTQRLLFGYTDHCDASINHLDPEMRIYFNSETVVQDMAYQTPNGPVMVPQVIAAHQLVSPLDLSGANGLVSAYHHRPVSYLIRPEDVFSVGQSKFVADKLTRTGRINGPIDEMYDSRAMVGHGGAYKYSRRQDTSPSRYLSRALQSFHHAVKEAEMADGLDAQTDRDLIYGEAQSYAANLDIQANEFFNILRDNAGFMERGYVTLRDLQQLFPELAHTMHYSLDDGRSIRRLNQRDDSAPWQGSDRTTLAATILGQVVPAIMMDNFIRTISFAATNGLGYGNYDIDIHEEGTRSVVDGLNMINYIQEFQRRLAVDVLNTISHNNQVRFQISMASDLAGESEIHIALDGMPVEKFVVPTFSDSLFSPVITHQRQAADKISADLLYLIEETVPVRHGPMVYAPPADGGLTHYQPELGQPQSTFSTNDYPTFDDDGLL